MLRKSIFSLVAISVALATAQGCGGGDSEGPPADNLPPADNRSGLSSDGDAPVETTFCDASMVAWNLDKTGKTNFSCGGGVEYQVFNTSCPVSLGNDDTCSQQGKGCPEQDTSTSHQEPNPPCNWSASMGTVHKSVMLQCHTETTCTGDCDSASASTSAGPPPCHCTGHTVCDPDCFTVSSNDAQAQRDGRFNGEHNGGQFYNWGGSVMASNVTPAGSQCQYDLINMPIAWHPNEYDAANCGTHTVTETTKHWPACQTVKWDDHSCGTTVHHLPAGQSLSNIAGLPTSGRWAFACGVDTQARTSPSGGASYGDVEPDGAKTLCMTDENNPIRDSSRASDVSAKFKRLTDFLAEADARQIKFDGIPDCDPTCADCCPTDPPGQGSVAAPGQGSAAPQFTLSAGGPTTATANAAVDNQIVRTIKLLFETYGDALSPADQQTAVNLYLTRSDASTTPACGAVFTPPNTAQCTADPAAISKLNSEMQFCARMASTHVTAAVQDLEAVKALCVDQLAADIGALRAKLPSGADDGTPYALPSPTDGGVGAPDPNDVCGFKKYRTLYDSFVTRTMDKRFEFPRDPSNATDVPELKARLALLNRWYKAISTNLYPYQSTDPQVASVQKAAWQHATDAEAAFWSGIYRRLFPAAPVTASDGGAIQPDGSGGSPPAATFTAEQLAALVQDTLKADRALLGLLFPTDSTSSLQNAPLLFLMADAFEAMSQRMHSVGVYHDMGCIYLGCGPATQSELVWLMQLLPEIPDTANLQKIVDAAGNAKDQTGAPMVKPEWLAVYRGILKNHPAFESAVLSVMGDPKYTYAANGEPALQNAEASKIPKPLQHLAGLMQSARAATQAYQTTGMFDPTARNHLPAGMADDTIQKILGIFKGNTDQLDQQKTTFQNGLSKMASDVIGELSAKGAMQHSRDNIIHKGVDFDTAMADIDGLRWSLEVNQHDFGQFVQSYSHLTAFDGTALLQTQTLGAWSADASSAKADGPIAPRTDLTSISIQHYTALSKGTIVNVQVGSGDRWNPTCALQRQNADKGGIGSPSSLGKYPIDLSDSLTGPEGYIVSFSSGNAAAHANQTGKNSTNTTESGIEAKLCTGLHIQGGLEFIGSGSHVYQDLSYCTSVGSTSAQSQTASSSDTLTNDSRTSANFASGLRLPNTPFPNLPVGALLAVVTDKGKPSSWRDVRVVSAPSTAIILGADSDVYFVTNDISVQGCTKGTSALTVNVSTAMHQADAIKWVQGGLATVGAYLDALSVGDTSTGIVNPAGGSLLAQGRLLPEQSSTIRSTSLVKMVGACNADPTVPDKTVCDLSKLPASVNEFITNYVDREIEKLNIKIELMQDARTLNGISMELQQMIDDYNAQQNQSRVAELIPQWQLRNLDGNLLQSQTAALVKSATYQIYPVLALRYPDVFMSLQKNSTLRDAVLPLVNAKWDDSIVDLAADTVTAARTLYSLTQTLVPDIVSNEVYLAFPAPGIPPSTLMNNASGARAAQAWAGATSPSHKATFRVLPEDLYNIHGGSFTLDCTQQAPVINDAVLFLAGGVDNTDEKALNNGAEIVPSFSALKMQFPRARLIDPSGIEFWPGGILDFDLDSSDGGDAHATMHTQILASSSEQAIKAKFDGRTLPPGQDPATFFHNGKGLSPFTDFTIDLTRLYNEAKYPGNILSRTRYLVLSLVVQTRSTTTGRAMTFINTCK